MAANPTRVTHEGVGDSFASTSSSGSQTTRLTPELDSDDSDLELEEDKLGHSVKLRPQDPEKVRRTRSTAQRDLDDGDDYELQSGRRGSASTMQPYQLYTPDEERAVIGKFDRRLVLIVALLYMLSFLDRSSMYMFHPCF
jgi:hypothetical protein